jgi:4-amino-4-deoxy-L-arabinose transferase-like glycosyltransferase
MLAVLPLLTFVFFVLACHRAGNGWRVSTLFASIPCALFVVFLTETLTPFRLVIRSSVIIGWLLFATAAFAWMWKVRQQPATAPNVFRRFAELRRMEKFSLGVILVIAALIALTALASAPNNWDAMEYHLPRVMEWINNRGVQFYPTLDWFQLDQPPFAEYSILHLHLLVGSDRLDALVQWFAYLGCILGAILLTRELGGGRRAQIFTAVLSATIPSAILGASGTKNDCVAAYWIVVATYLLLRWRRNQSWALTLAIGAALGLAAFTKGTSYIFLPCIVLACVGMGSAGTNRRFFLRLPVILVVVLLICGPLWARNYQYSGSPMGIPYFRGVGTVQQRMLRNQHFMPSQIAADVARSTSLNFGVRSARINSMSTAIISGLMRSIGVNPNDPGQMSIRQSGEALPFRVSFNPRDEFFSEDPIHLLLFLLAAALCIVRWRRIGWRTGCFGLGLVAAFVLFCALLRWAPTNERYLIPLIVPGAAFTSVVLVQLLPKWFVNSAIFLLLLVALPLAMLNQTRPLITRRGIIGGILTTPRNETYFFDYHEAIASSFIMAAQTARASSCRSIGIDANLQHFEYPLMAMLTNDGLSRQVRYVGVENSSTQYAQLSAQPVCMVLCLRCLDHEEKIAQYSTELPKTQSFGTLVMFSK